MLHLADDDATEFGIGFDYQPTRRRLQREPPTQARFQQFIWRAELARFCGEIADHLIDRQFGAERRLRPGSANKDAAALAEFNPAIGFELTVRCARGVGVDAEAAGEVARTWEALAWGKLMAKNPENHLRDELVAQGNFAGAVEPEAHTCSFSL